MKKLLFTAIAMVAFSSASMANTIAVEEERKLPCETIAVISMIIAEEEYASNQLEQGIANACFDSWTYNHIYQLYLDDCNNNNN